MSDLGKIIVNSVLKMKAKKGSEQTTVYIHIDVVADNRSGEGDQKIIRIIIKIRVLSKKI